MVNESTPANAKRDRQDGAIAQSSVDSSTDSPPLNLFSGADKSVQIQYFAHEAINMQTMQTERMKAKFNVRQLTHLLHGGPSMTAIFEQLYKDLQNDPLFQNDTIDLTTEEQRKLSMLRMKRIVEYRHIEDSTLHAHRITVLNAFDNTLIIRYLVHMVLFLNAIQQNGTDEQIAALCPDIEASRTIGCFAMTELGHGSYVPGLETTATFDKETDSFIIDTPTETATKWWIGGAAHTAVACVCYARLLINGTQHGIHIFYVPLRHRDTFDLLPGINIGDCGIKMGRQGLDNGWIQFNHVRVPRTAMLMRYAKVSKDGVFTQPSSMQLAYGPLVYGRLLVLKASILTMKRALTIAIRYAAVRRQFSQPQQQLEKQILDYATHKRRLMPLLAETYALHFTGEMAEKLATEMKEKLKMNDPSLLLDLHPVAAGFKAFSSWFTLGALEECRQSCGGLGYSAYSGLPGMLTEFAVMCTWEGDNTVMAQQTARYLIKSLQRAMNGEKEALTGSVDYLQDVTATLSSRFPNISSKEALFSLENQDLAFKYVATRSISDAALKLKKGLKQGLSMEEAWNNATVEMVQCAKAHSYYYMMRCFSKALNVPESAKQNAKDDKSMIDILTKLYHLFVWYSLHSYFLPYLVEDGFLNESKSAIQFIVTLISDLCDEIRDQAIPLVDAFNLSDFIVKSPLGRYDGNVYRSYFDRVKQFPGSQTKPVYFEEAIKPLLLGRFSKHE